MAPDAQRCALLVEPKSTLPEWFFSFAFCLPVGDADIAEEVGVQLREGAALAGTLVPAGERSPEVPPAPGQI